MAIPKKGSRSIVVNGTTYRWYVRRNPTYSQCYNVWNGGSGHLTFCVEHGDTPACTLVVNLPNAHPGINAGSPVLPILPSLVAQQIERALAAGWKATTRGSAFRLGGFEH